MQTRLHKQFRDRFREPRAGSMGRNISKSKVANNNNNGRPNGSGKPNRKHVANQQQQHGPNRAEVKANNTRARVYRDIVKANNGNAKANYVKAKGTNNNQRSHVPKREAFCPHTTTFIQPHAVVARVQYESDSEGTNYFSCLSEEEFEPHVNNVVSERLVADNIEVPKPINKKRRWKANQRSKRYYRPKNLDNKGNQMYAKRPQKEFSRQAKKRLDALFNQHFNDLDLDGLICELEGQRHRPKQCPTYVRSKSNKFKAKKHRQRVRKGADNKSMIDDVFSEVHTHVTRGGYEYPSSTKCYRCGTGGHKAYQCLVKRECALCQSTYDFKGQCFKCGCFGHKVLCVS